MTYAVWIGIAVIFIAIAPGIIRNHRNRRRDGAPGGESRDTGGEGSGGD